VLLNKDFDLFMLIRLWTREGEDVNMKNVMRFARTFSVALVVAAVVGGIGLASRAHAEIVTTVQPTAPSDRDPAWGQGITLNVGASLPDFAIPATVNLDLVGLRTGLSSAGSPDDRTAVYMHVYDNFALNLDGSVNDAAIGSLMAVSSNTVDLETPADSTDVFWFFGGAALAKDTTYHYILATDTVAAAPGSFANLIYSDFVVAYGNPHAGGQHYRQTGDLGDGPASGDLFFRVQSSFEPVAVPEPSTLTLLGIGCVALLGLGYRKRRI